MDSQVSALTTVIGGTFYQYDGELTFVGKVMAQLPMDVCLSKMILLGFVFGVMEDCIIMGERMLALLFVQVVAKYIPGFKMSQSLFTWNTSTLGDDQTRHLCFLHLEQDETW